MAQTPSVYLDVQAVANYLTFMVKGVSPLTNRFLSSPESKDFTIAPGQRGPVANILLMNRANSAPGFKSGTEATAYKQISERIEINHILVSDRPLSLKAAAFNKLNDGTSAKYENFSRNFAKEAAVSLALSMEVDLIRHIFSKGVGFEIDDNAEIIANSFHAVTTSGPLFYHGNSEQEISNNTIMSAFTHYGSLVGQGQILEMAVSPVTSDIVAQQIGANVFAPDFIEKNLFNSTWAMGTLSGGQMVFKLGFDALHLAGVDSGKELTVKSVNDTGNGFNVITLSGGTVSSTVENLNVGDIGTITSGKASLNTFLSNVSSGYRPQFVVANSTKSNAAGEFDITVRTNGTSKWTWDAKEQDVQLTDTIVDSKIRFEGNHIASVIYNKNNLVLPTVEIPMLSGIPQYRATAPDSKFSVLVTELIKEDGDSQSVVIKANVWYGAFMWGATSMRVLGKIPSVLNAPVARFEDELLMIKDKARTKKQAMMDSLALHEMQKEIEMQQKMHDIEVMKYQNQINALMEKVDKNDNEVKELREYIDSLVTKKR